MLSKRNFLQLGAALPLLASCNFNAYRPKLINGEVINITRDTTLGRDYTGTHFVIHEGATLDLNGHTLFGKVPSGHTGRAFSLAGSGSTIKNGSITGYYRDGIALSGLESGYLDALKGVSKSTAQEIGEEYRSRVNNDFTVDGLTIRDTVGSGLFAAAFSVGLKVVNCNMVGTGLMHIYADHGSAGHLFENNYFGRAGENHIKGREGIALDACVDVIVRNNIFNGRMNMGCINAYTNWGENGITREITRGHSLYGNLFRDNWRAISLASRQNRRFAGATAADYAENISVFDNEFDGIGLHVEDLGQNNTVS